ncbi:hypothetical protein LDENG_00296060 [Lucifuga dentata]|nr:hypothetical protein LDENG_00296060 [Lucifuga dentata]
MKSLLWCRSVHLLIVLCGHLAHAATEAGITSQVNVSIQSSPTVETDFSSATPAPGGTEAGSDEVTPVPGSTENTNTTVSAENTTLSTSESTENTTLPASEAPTTATTSPPEGCPCNLTPDFCDIGCCCDTDDCGIANLGTIFSGCSEKAISQVCIEKWLMFKANVDPSLIAVTDSLFCVRAEDKAAAPQPVPAVPQYSALGNFDHFSPPGITAVSFHTRDFYRVDDVILTHFSKSSARGLLRQPSPGATSEFCVNRNPAQFMRSASLSCTRTVTLQSCTTGPNLNAHSYYSDLSLIRVPIAETVQVSNYLIPVTPLSDWPAPSELNNFCYNVVKTVEFVIGYTSRGEITSATVNVVLANVTLNQLLLQKHSVKFQLASLGPTRGPIPAVGLKVGSPVIGRFNKTLKPLTTLGMSQGGVCSSDPNMRAPVLFTHDIITGCTFRSQSNDCLDLRSQIQGILQGLAIPDLIAMNSGSQPNWTRVITQECPISSQETCQSGCILPHSLSIQVLWARQGLLDLPQSYILGAKYVFHCQKFKCPLSSPLTLTTKVIFADTTVYPEPPRGLPQPHWKFPFGFFTRGAEELDYYYANSSESNKDMWSAMLFTVMLLTGLEFFTR